MLLLVTVSQQKIALTITCVGIRCSWCVHISGVGDISRRV